MMIFFYYGLTGFACVIYYRRELTKSVSNFVFMGVLPLLGGVILTWALVKSSIDLSDPENSESGDSWLGLGPPLVIAIGFAIMGVVLMLLQQATAPAFFRRKAEVVDPEVAAGRATVEDALVVED